MQQAKQLRGPKTEVAADVVFLRDILVGLMALTCSCAGIVFALL